MVAFALIDYKGLLVGNQVPAQAGGAAVDGNAKELADRVGPVAEVAGAPTVNSDSDNTDTNGVFYKWSKWRNTSTNAVYICLDPTPTAAVWVNLTAAGGGLNQSVNGGTFTEDAQGGNAGGHTQNSDCSILANADGATTTGSTKASGGFTAKIDGSSQGGGTSAYVSASTQNSSFNVWGLYGCSGRGYAINAEVGIDGLGSHGLVSALNGGSAETQGDASIIMGRCNGAASVILAGNDNTFVLGWPEAGETASATGNRSVQLGVGTVATAKTVQIGAGVLSVDYTPASEKIGVFAAAPVVQPAGANQVGITNSTGGAYDGTLAAVGDTSTGDESGAINDNFTDLFTLQNEMRTALVALGWMKGAA